jgi:hypothetical protein
MKTVVLETKIALFQAITQRVVVIPYRRFGTISQRCFSLWGYRELNEMGICEYLRTRRI